MCSHVFKQHPVYELVGLGQIQSHALGSLPSVDGDTLTYMPVARSRGTRLLVEGIALSCLVQAGMFEHCWFDSWFFFCAVKFTPPCNAMREISVWTKGCPPEGFSRTSGDVQVPSCSCAKHWADKWLSAGRGLLDSHDDLVCLCSGLMLLCTLPDVL